MRAPRPRAVKSVAVGSNTQIKAIGSFLLHASPVRRDDDPVHAPRPGNDVVSGQKRRVVAAHVPVPGGVVHVRFLEGCVHCDRTRNASSSKQLTPMTMPTLPVSVTCNTGWENTLPGFCTTVPEVVTAISETPAR